MSRASRLSPQTCLGVPIGTPVTQATVDFHATAFLVASETRQSVSGNLLSSGANLHFVSVKAFI